MLVGWPESLWSGRTSPRMTPTRPALLAVQNHGVATHPPPMRLFRVRKRVQLGARVMPPVQANADGHLARAVLGHVIGVAFGPSARLCFRVRLRVRARVDVRQTCPSVRSRAALCLPREQRVEVRGERVGEGRLAGSRRTGL